MWYAASDAARHASASAGNDTQELLLLRRDIEDQYRMFAVLEPSLANPRSLYSQPLFQLTVADLNALVEKCDFLVIFIICCTNLQKRKPTGIIRLTMLWFVNFLGKN
jgi:hypothetical protein